MKTGKPALFIGLFFPVLLCYKMQAQTCVSTFPYVESFNPGSPGWKTQFSNIWDIDAVRTDYIGCSGIFNRCLVTLGEYHYPNGIADEWAISPCFNFSSFNYDPILTFDLSYQTENGLTNDDDYCRLEVSTDSINWTTVGQQGYGMNWYTTTNGWAGANRYSKSAIQLSGLKGQSTAYLRFVFHSNNQYNFDGVAIDEITIFNPPANDASVVSINNLRSGCDMGTEKVEVTLLNIGGTTITNCPVQYRYRLGQGNYSPWTAAGNFIGTLAPGDSTLFDFNFNFSTKGSYYLDVQTQLIGDTETGNDLASSSLTHYQAISIFPAVDSFHNYNNSWITGGVNSTWDIGQPASANLNYNFYGGNSAVTNLRGDYNAYETSYLQSPCYDLSAISHPVIEIELFYDLAAGDGVNLEYSTDAGGTWIVAGKKGEFLNWYNANNNARLGGKGAWEGSSNSWLTASDTLNAVAEEGEVIFRFKFASGIDSVNLDGFGVDLFTVWNTPPDVGIYSMELINSSGMGCGLGSMDSVKIKIQNFSLHPIYDIPVQYRFGQSGAWLPAGIFTDTIKGSIESFYFTADFSQFGQQTLQVRTAHPLDMVPANDTAQVSVYNIPLSYPSLPHCEGFENGSGNWAALGTNSSWERGTPAGAVINAASGGTKAWATNLTGNYNNSELSYLVSPCFDLSGMDSIKVTFDLWCESPGNIDGLSFESNAAGSANWTTETFLVNNYPSFNQWYGSSGQWVTAQGYISQAGKAGVSLRFRFASDGSTVGEGFAIDNVCIYLEKQGLTSFPGTCITSTVKGIKGNKTVDFLDSDGKYLAYLNPNGNDLGQVTCTMNDIEVPLQSYNGEYYIPRYFNLECSGGADCPSSGNFPKGNVTVGFLIETAEINDYNFINGTNYPMADLNATHFDGPNENCTLHDNTGGAYSLVSKNNITAKNYNYPLGFSLEFNTPTFSEFGFHGSSIPLGASAPLPLELLDFRGKVLENANQLEWTTATERNVAWHIVERSANGRLWEAVGRTAGAPISNSPMHYSLQDHAPLADAHYRLQSVDFDGEINYSQTISLRRETELGGIEIFPNPTKGASVLQFIAVGESPANIQITDLAGMLVKDFNGITSEGLNAIEIGTDGLAAGVYIVKCSVEGGLMGVVRLVKYQ